MQKTIQVDLKSEISRLTTEKEQLDKKLRYANEKVRNKTSEFEALVGKPMDELVRREEREEARQKALDVMTDEQIKLEDANRELNETLFKTQERVLDLKFEKETFDLQYARLQKRISDLEQYKLQSNQLSAVMKNKHDLEIAEI